MRIYLDNCCFNRPFDDQSQDKIQHETESKLLIQERILNGKFKLIWSYILDYENSMNPFNERSEVIRLWRNYAFTDIIETPIVLEKSKELRKMGIKSMDALHIACAISSNCAYFITTDEAILKKMKDCTDIVVLDPPAFVRRLEL